MAVEIEKKYRLGPGDAARISAVLMELGAEFAGRDFEENNIFANDELRERRAIARLRRIGERTILTFKERRDDGGDAKTHIEHETEVIDFSAAASILGELGLKAMLIYEKRRETWRFRDVLVMIDALPFGDFAEIEGDHDAIAEAEALLGADSLEAEIRTYPQLTAAFGLRSGDLVEARFSMAASEECK